PRAALVVQGVRGPAGLGGGEALGRDARQPAPARARRVRLPRRRHAVLRGRAGARPAADPRRAARPDRGPLLRGRAHDVRPRAEPAAAVGRPRGVRHRRALRSITFRSGSAGSWSTRTWVRPSRRGPGSSRRPSLLATWV